VDLRLSYQMMLLQRRSSALTKATTLPLTPTELQSQYGRVVLRYLATRVPRFTDAEDLTVDVFVSAFGAIAKCPRQVIGDGSDTELDPIRAWLFTIARNKAIDHLRKNKTRPIESAEPLEDYTTLSTPSTESIALQREKQHAIRQVLAQLPTDQREALLLKYVDGLSLQEIGIVLGKRPEAISSLLQRARASARQHGAAYFGEKGE
jgi:RNA polymerase sigma-70 factor, ECF subfamily